MELSMKLGQNHVSNFMKGTFCQMVINFNFGSFIVENKSYKVHDNTIATKSKIV